MIYIVEVSTAVAKEFAETETSQGVFAVCKQPVLEDNVMTTWRKVLLIDAVQDPGNIGTMIRTADLCRFRCCNFRKRLCRSL